MIISVFDRTEKIVEKDKKLVISIFSFPHDVFKSSMFYGH